MSPLAEQFCFCQKTTFEPQAEVLYSFKRNPLQNLLGHNTIQYLSFAWKVWFWCFSLEGFVLREAGSNAKLTKNLTLSETNIAPENGWSEYELFFWGPPAYFQWLFWNFLSVSFSPAKLLFWSILPDPGRPFETNSNAIAGCQVSPCCQGVRELPQQNSSKMGMAWRIGYDSLSYCWWTKSYTTWDG